jgi:hypothetical protein
LQYFLWAVAAIVIAATTTKIRRQRSKIAPIRKEILDQRIVFRTRVNAKYLTDAGGWSMKTLGGMELIVRANMIQVTLIFHALGGLLGSEWYFESEKTEIQHSTDPSPNFLVRDWIIIRSADLKRHAEVAIWSKENQVAIWSALVDSGARPS